MHASLARCRALELPALLSVAERCRAIDRQEQAAVGVHDVMQNAVQLVEATTIGATIHDDAGVPQAALGVLPTLPGVYGAWLTATDEWPRVWRTAFRWGRDVLIPTLIANGARRCTAACPVANVPAQRFLEHLGLEREGHMRKFGEDGSDWFFYARVV